MELCRHSACPHAGTSSAHVDSTKFIGCINLGDQTSPGLRGRRCIQSINVCQQDQDIRANHLCNVCRKPVIITKTHFTSRHCVILIDDRHDPESKELIECRHCIRIVLALHDVGCGEQNLRNVEVVSLESG